MDLEIKNKNALVLASSKGLGKAVAQQMCKEGASVMICSRNEEELLNAKQSIQNHTGGRVFHVNGDLTIKSDRENILHQCSIQMGHIDILVTNTGGPPSGIFENFDLAHWEAAFKLLVEPTVTMIQGVLPAMKANKWGRIIMITSQAVKQPVDNLILSNSVRMALVGLNKSLANELGKFNITVNNVLPGYTKTDRLNSLIQSNPAINQVIKDIPLGRFAEPEEFANIVTFLASEKASYMTGTSIPVDGGWIKGV